MTLRIGVRVKITHIDDSEPAGMYDRFIGKEGEIVEFYPYTGGYFSPPYFVRIANGDSLCFYPRELEVIESDAP